MALHESILLLEKDVRRCGLVRDAGTMQTTFDREV